jgi:hypothetical protein
MMPPYAGVMASNKDAGLQAFPRFGIFYLAYNHRKGKGLFYAPEQSLSGTFRQNSQNLTPVGICNDVSFISIDR